jgi:aminotransferase
VPRRGSCRCGGPTAQRDWRYDSDELAAAFSNKTRAIIINTPNNPTGKVFSRAELEEIAGLCRHWGAIAVTDEIYDHILYDGAVHVPMAGLDGMAERTVTINSVSKTFSVTGWRVGWTIGPPDITSAIRKVHDFLTVGAAAPLQAAAAAALALPASYYTELAAQYSIRRDRLLGILNDAGFTCYAPRGAYYIMTDISAFGFPDDVAFARHLVTDIGVAAVPGSSFYKDTKAGSQKLRFLLLQERRDVESSGDEAGQLEACAAGQTVTLAWTHEP